jgi:hypothetical protein
VTAEFIAARRQSMQRGFIRSTFWKKVCCGSALPTPPKHFRWPPRGAPASAGFKSDSTIRWKLAGDVLFSLKHWKSTQRQLPHDRHDAATASTTNLPSPGNSQE